MSIDPRVVAVREDKLVGKGTCSAIDECWTDDNLVEQFDEDGIVTPKQAVEWCFEYEDLHMEQAPNQSSGEPDCPAMAVWNEWQDRKKEAGR